jgi:dipeptidase D
MNDIRILEPKQMWNYFHEICQIPHPSKKEQKIIAYMKEFGEIVFLAKLFHVGDNFLLFF